MIEIKHKVTGKVLHTIEGDTLAGADLRAAMLDKADLSDADLRGTDLTRANLARADLNGADLSKATLIAASLIGADISRANLSGAILYGAILTRADLSGGILSGAVFNGADLSGADLSGTYMSGTCLSGNDLSHANLSRAILMETVFSNCDTLHLARGLDTIRPSAPSVIDTRTLRACVSHLPDVFLQGVGYTIEEIETLRAMYRQGIQYYSCFISYAHTNREFADHLRSNLVAKNVSCWQDVHDMQGGDFWRKQINEAIKVHDKLIVVCSQDSLSRKEVVEEIIEAIEYEREAGAQKLFPVRVDNFLFGDEIKTVYAALPPRQRREDWLTYLKDYHVPDFSDWKNFDTFQGEFEKLLKALKSPAHR